MAWVYVLFHPCVANMYLQWTVARELPITNGEVWLSSFLTLSMVFIALVCLQCFASGYMDAQKPDKAVPGWLKCLIDFSLLRIPYLTEEALDDEIEAHSRLQQQQQQQQQGHGDNGDDDPAASSSGVHGIPLQVLSPLGHEQSPGASERGESSGQKDQQSRDSSRDSSRDRDRESDAVGGQEGGGEELLSTRGRKYTWQRGSRSFDRVCRLVIPAFFAVFVGVELGTTS
jgi:hypothetical protein